MAEQPHGADRDAFQARLVGVGLGRRGAHLAHEIAEVGLRLRSAKDGAESRLGWPALLPPGEPWPHARGQRPLTFLAGISLAELPIHGPLPEAGWLLFFADIENSDALGLIDEASNAADSSARALYVPPGAEPVRADPPAELRDILRARPVRAVPELTLPDDDEAPERLGLDQAETEAYEDLMYELRTASGDQVSPPADHWVLGAWTGVQGSPSEPGTLLLLHVSNDESLTFAFLDGGAIQFRIPREALVARDWSAVIAQADSC